MDQFTAFLTAKKWMNFAMNRIMIGANMAFQIININRFTYAASGANIDTSIFLILIHRYFVRALKPAVIKALSVIPVDSLTEEATSIGLFIQPAE